MAGLRNRIFLQDQDQLAPRTPPCTAISANLAIVVVDWNLCLDPDTNYEVIKQRHPRAALENALNEPAAATNSKAINIEWATKMPLICVTASNGFCVSTKDVLIALYNKLQQPLSDDEFRIIKSLSSLYQLTAMNAEWKKRCADTIDPTKKTLAELRGALCVDTLLSHKIYSHIEHIGRATYKLHVRPKQ